MHRVRLLTQFCELLTTVAILSGGTCRKGLSGTTPLMKWDKLCANQELIFDYKGTLTETGSRSFVDSFDITHLMGRPGLHRFPSFALLITDVQGGPKKETTIKNH